MEWIISATLPSIVVGLFMAVFNRRQKRKDDGMERRAKARQHESLLGMELTMSAAKLSYATAVALKRGYANGEVEDGVEAYETAKGKYLTFLNEQAIEHIAD